MKLPVPIPEDFFGEIYCPDKKTGRKILELIEKGQLHRRWNTGHYPTAWDIGIFPSVIVVPREPGMSYKACSTTTTASLHYIYEEEEYLEI